MRTFLLRVVALCETMETRVERDAFWTGIRIILGTDVEIELRTAHLFARDHYLDRGKYPTLAEWQRYIEIDPKSVLYRFRLSEHIQFSFFWD